MIPSRFHTRASGAVTTLLLASVLLSAAALLPGCGGRDGRGFDDRGRDVTGTTDTGLMDQGANPQVGTPTQTGETATQPAPEPSFPPGSFVIRSNPSGANVYIDGRLIGRTPVAYQKDGNPQHLIFLTRDGYASQIMYADFTGESTTVDLAFIGFEEGNRESLAARSLLPEVTPVENPAGNRAWRIKGLSSFGAAVSPDGRYLVGSVHAAEKRAQRADIVAIDLQSGGARRVVSHVNDSRLLIGGLDVPLGWLSDRDVAILTQRQPADDPENPALSLLKVDLSTGKQEPLGDFGRLAEGPVHIHGAWLTSDSREAFVHVSGHIWGLDLAKKQRVIDLPVPTWDGLFRVSPSPDGWSAAHPEYDQEQGNALVYWLNLRTGEDKPVSPPGVYAQGGWWSPDSRRLAFGVSPRHAGGYPELVQEDSNLLLPEAVQVVDLPGLFRQQFDLPRTPATLKIMDGFRQMLVTRVEVIDDRNTADGWRLESQGLSLLNLETGKTGSETPLEVPAGYYLRGIRPEGDLGYLITLEPYDGPPFGSAGWPATRLARLHPDGRIEMLPGRVVDDRDPAQAGADWPLLWFEDGLGGLDGRRLLTGPATKTPYFLRLASNGWLLLDDPVQQGDEFVFMASPSASD